MKGLLFGALGLAAGLVIGMVVKGSGSTAGTEAHWRVVREHLRLIENPKNFKVDESLGLASVEIKTDPIPSLYALASAGEIEHRDIVLPNVPANRESTGFWMKFCEEREGIIYATGNASFGGFVIEDILLQGVITIESDGLREICDVLRLSADERIRTCTSRSP